MVYRKVAETSMIVRKGDPASCLRVLISGSCNAYTQDPQMPAQKGRRFSLAMVAAKAAKASVEAYQTVKLSEVIKIGDAIGEDELLQEDPVHLATVITNEPVELMEIPRADFDRILKADRSSERGLLLEFLQSLPVMEGTSIAAVNALSQLVTFKSFTRDQLCLAHPPDPSLGSASFSNDFVYLIYHGEARLMGAPELFGSKRPLPLIDASSPAFGPLADVPSPLSATIYKALGANLVPVATLGPGEIVSENLFGVASARWCLQPVSELQLLVVPRKEWHDVIRQSALAELKELASAKAGFFEAHLAAVSRQIGFIQGAGNRNASATPRQEAHSLSGGALSMSAPAKLSRQGNDLLNSAGGKSKPRLPKRGPRDLPPLGRDAFTPPIRLGKGSLVGRRPMVS